MFMRSGLMSFRRRLLGAGRPVFLAGFRPGGCLRMSRHGFLMLGGMGRLGVRGFLLQGQRLTLFGLLPFLLSRILLRLLMLTGSLLFHLLMLACSFMLGVLLGGVQPTVMILIHHITPPQRQGDAMATRFIMINASAISMPMLYGAAGGFVSASGVFLAAAGVVGLGAALGLWSERNHTADGSH
jgi:hypothetical protein